MVQPYLFVLCCVVDRPLSLSRSVLNVKSFPLWAVCNTADSQAYTVDFPESELCLQCFTGNSLADRLSKITGAVTAPCDSVLLLRVLPLSLSVSARGSPTASSVLIYTSSPHPLINPHLQGHLLTPRFLENNNESPVPPRSRHKWRNIQIANLSVRPPNSHLTIRPTTNR